jgi:hypothetical protein
MTPFMHAQLESLLAVYLTRGGKVFISPQYDKAFDQEAREGGACPDVVALDMEKREVVIVEISSVADLSILYNRVEARKIRWFVPIQRRLQDDRIIDTNWQFRFLGFVRESMMDNAKARFGSDPDVCFVPLEKASMSFAYWAEREKNGLPR